MTQPPFKTTLFRFFSLAFMLVLLLSIEAVPYEDFEKSKKRGEAIYRQHCQSCHMAEGEGIPGVFPPLAKSDYLMADKERSIAQSIFGVSGKIVVNGISYDGEMPESGLKDEEIRDVLNFVRNSWGNNGEEVSLGEVKKVRKKGA